MKKGIRFVRNTLLSCIEEVGKKSEKYVFRPGKDYSRERKMSFSGLIRSVISLEGGSLSKELLHVCTKKHEWISKSGFCQQREKVRPEAFESVFHSFTEKALRNAKKYNGYRIFACDGSDISFRTKDKTISFQSCDDGKTYGLLHLNLLYDLLNHVYTDCVIQTKRQCNEPRACIEMLYRKGLFGKAILLADRGYEGYNLLMHLQTLGCFYAIRVKDIDSIGIASRLQVPATDEFDTAYTLILTRKSIKHDPRPNLVRINPRKAFDFIEKGSKAECKLKFRLVRFQIKEGLYEVLITNLDACNWSMDDLKALYNMRWGIETSVRDLKYPIGLNCFHSLKTDFILQEIFARLITYNFCQLIIGRIDVPALNRKNDCKINFSAAASVCKEYLKYNNYSPQQIKLLIIRCLEHQTDRAANINEKISGTKLLDYLTE